MFAFSWTIDAPIVAVYLLLTMSAGIWVRRYVGKVEDFLVAGREMNVYLGIASLAATEFGIVTCMYAAELGYLHGFSGATPGVFVALSLLFIGGTGFCIKPLREAGVLTIPELLERRFGPRIRWAAGLVIVLGGLLNMGVFLRTGGEFLMLTCRVDPQYLEWTMTVLLVGVGAYTILGGMLSVLVTDFFQFIVMSAGLLAVTMLILENIGWSALAETVNSRNGPGGFNPLLNAELGWSFVVFQMLSAAAAMLTWQTTIARVLAAKDAQTGAKIYTRTSFFFVCRFLIPVIWGIAAATILTADELKSVTGFGENKESILAMPLALSKIVPPGLMGLLIAAMLAADMSTDSSYMLTWGSVIYNDLLGPFRDRNRRGADAERRGILWNRLIVAAIGLFLLFFGLWFQPEGDLWSYLLVTGSIYLSSMVTLLIACCYWPRANSWGAAAAIVVGAVLPITHLVCTKLPATSAFAKANTNVWGIATYASCAAAMIIGSLLKPKAAQEE